MNGEGAQPSCRFPRRLFSIDAASFSSLSWKRTTPSVSIQSSFSTRFGNLQSLQTGKGENMEKLLSPLAAQHSERRDWFFFSPVTYSKRDERADVSFRFSLKPRYVNFCPNYVVVSSK